MQTQGYNLEGLAQANAILTSSNYTIMAQLAQMIVTMKAMHAQLKTLASAKTNQASPKRKFYCWSCGSNFTHGSKTWSAKKAGHQEEAYYKKIFGGSEKGCAWRLGAKGNKIKIINPKISLINHIDTPTNTTSTNMLVIVDSGTNIHLSRQATHTMSPVIMDIEMNRWNHYGVDIYSNITATRSKQDNDTDPHFPENADSPINIIGGLMWWWMHHHTR